MNEQLKTVLKKGGVILARVEPRAIPVAVAVAMQFPALRRQVMYKAGEIAREQFDKLLRK